MTKEEAITFYESGKWKGMTYEEKAKFQLKEEKLCMPFEVFHEAVEKATGHAVWTHMFGDEKILDKIRKELGLTPWWN